MKISELKSQVTISKKQDTDSLCINCRKPKIKHTRPQTENCIRAIYFKA